MNGHRLPGNGASSNSVEEESTPVATAAPPPSAPGLTEQKPTAGHVKTPKLSRFFSSGRKRSKSPASKRSVTAPPAPNEVKTSFMTISSTKASPKCKTQLLVSSKSDKEKLKNNKSPKKNSKVPKSKRHQRIVSSLPHFCTTGGYEERRR